jgi:hypothetical protein
LTGSMLSLLLEPVATFFTVIPDNVALRRD